MTFVARVLFAFVLALVSFTGSFAQTSPAQPGDPISFDAFITQRFSKSDPAWSFEKFCPASTNVVAARVLREYGSIFSAADSIQMPTVCLHAGEADVLKFQKSVPAKEVLIEGTIIRLQEKAADALIHALSEAHDRQLTISPLDGAIAGSRTYGDTLMLWNGRFFSALDFWTRRGRLNAVDREEITKLDLQRRIEKILEWESHGIWFSKDKSRSIFSSTAPPGTSQHLAMIAFDVVEYGNPEVRAILNRHGWFQTVLADPPHFTFLGLPETALPGRGLRAVAKSGYQYWIPNLITVTH